MTNHFPNLSYLKLAEKDVGALAGDPPPSSASADSYEDGMFGFNAMTLVAKSVTAVGATPPTGQRTMKGTFTASS